MILIEGVWFARSAPPVEGEDFPWDGGAPADALQGALEPLFGRVEHHRLSDDEALWGGPVADERYAVIAHSPRLSWRRR